MKKEKLSEIKKGKNAKVRIVAVKKRGILEVACGDMEVLYRLEPLCCIRVEADSGVIIKRCGDYNRVKVTLAKDESKKKDRGRGKISRKKNPKKRILISIPKKWSIISSNHRGAISKAL